MQSNFQKQQTLYEIKKREGCLTALNCNKVCFDLICILIQIAILITLSIVFYTANNLDFSNKINPRAQEDFYRLILALLIIYILYVIIALVSPEFKVLFKIKNSQGFKDIMQSLFTKSMRIIFKGFLFSYSPKTLNRQGKLKKNINFIEKKLFEYFSCRDISGTFNLDAEKNLKRTSKLFLNLSFKHEFEFADELSLYDFNNRLEAFITMYRKKDNFMDFNEERFIGNLNDDNNKNILVAIDSGRRSCGLLNIYLYMIFTFFIPIVQIYKVYINSKISDYEIVIKKLISTRFDLNSPLFSKNFNQLNTKIIIHDEEINIKEDEFIINNNANQTYQQPIKEEFEKAKIYNEKFAKKILEYKVNFGISPLELDESYFDASEVQEASISENSEKSFRDKRNKIAKHLRHSEMPKNKIKLEKLEIKKTKYFYDDCSLNFSFSKDCQSHYNNDNTDKEFSFDVKRFTKGKDYEYEDYQRTDKKSNVNRINIKAYSNSDTITLANLNVEMTLVNLSVMKNNIDLEKNLI